MRTLKFDSYKDVVKDMKHLQFHIDELKSTFPDLMVDRQEGGEYAFLSVGVNAIADNAEFKSQGASYAYMIHYAMPYKEIETKCELCREKFSVVSVRVNSVPDRIPVMITQDGDEPLVYTTSFEDSFEQLKFSKTLIGKTRLFLIDFLKERVESNKARKFDEIFILNSVKKLMTFS